MDALDPMTSVEIAGGLYNDTSFVKSLFNGLTAEGVVSLFGVCMRRKLLTYQISLLFQFAVQMGKSKMITDPHDEIGRYKDTGLMVSKQAILLAMASNRSDFLNTCFSRCRSRHWSNQGLKASTNMMRYVALSFA